MAVQTLSSFPSQLVLSGTPAMQQHNLSVNGSKLVLWNMTTDIGGNYIIFADIHAANASAKTANITVQVISALKVGIIEPNSGSQANITPNESFNAIVNVSFNGTILNDTALSQSNFSAQIGDVQENITNSSYDSGLWNLTIRAGEINESVDYILKITVNYGNYTTIGESLQAVHGKEMPPNISFATLPTRVLVNTNALLIATVTDNSEVANVAGNLTHPNASSTVFNFTKNFDDYTYWFTPSNIGIYNVSILATDIFGVKAELNTSIVSNGPPQIHSVRVLPSRYLFPDEEQTILVNASSPLGVKNVTVNITNLVGGINSSVADNTPSGYNLTSNYTDLGVYDYAVLVEDDYNNTNTYASDFEIRDSIYVNITTDINTTLLLEGEREFSSNANYTGTVLIGNYSLILKDENLTISLLNISIHSNITGGVNLTQINSTNSTKFDFHRGYEMNSDIPYAGVNISMVYNGSAVNSSKLAIFRCGDFSGGNCTSTWEELASSTDASTNRTSALADGLSAYALGERHSFSLSLTSASPTSDLRSGDTILVKVNLLYDSAAVSNVSFSADVDGTSAGVSQAGNGTEWEIIVSAPAVSGGSHTLRIYASYGD